MLLHKHTKLQSSTALPLTLPLNARDIQPNGNERRRLESRRPPRTNPCKSFTSCHLLNALLENKTKP